MPTECAEYVEKIEQSNGDSCGGSSTDIRIGVGTMLDAVRRRWTPIERRLVSATPEDNTRGFRVPTSTRRLARVLPLGHTATSR